MSKLPGRGTHNQRVESTHFDNSPTNRALWNLSLIMKEIANNAQDGASPHNNKAAIQKPDRS